MSLSKNKTNKDNNKKYKKNDAAKARGISKIKADRKHILSQKSSFYLREAYKTLRTNINFALPDKDGCKLILVTSAMQSEGKTLTAVNLAISLGQTDAKVVIIDCDLRRPKLARLLNIKAEAGVSNLLVTSQPTDVIIKDDSRGIDVITSGDIPPNPSELLASAKMQKLLEDLREKYDYIIIDSPPVDMVVDAVVLAPYCDGVLFVVKASSSERGAVIHAMEQLTYAKANVLGFAFNGVTSETGSGYGKYRYKHYKGYGRYRRYDYYRQYGYGYGYGYSSQKPTDNPKS